MNRALRVVFGTLTLLFFLPAAGQAFNAGEAFGKPVLPPGGVRKL